MLRLVSIERCSVRRGLTVYLPLSSVSLSHIYMDPYTTTVEYERRWAMNSEMTILFPAASSQVDVME